MPSDTAQKIIDLAETAICTRGYTSFSFREIAAELGIKSASIHYHFPTKTDLGVSVAEQYLKRYQQALDHIAASHSTSSERINAFVGLYRHEMLHGQRIAMCTMLSAEKMRLPEALQTLLSHFFHINLTWLREQAGLSETKAIQVFALLQGAFTGGKTLADQGYFDAAVAGIEACMRA